MILRRILFTKISIYSVSLCPQIPNQQHTSIIPYWLYGCGDSRYDDPGVQILTPPLPSSFAWATQLNILYFHFLFCYMGLIIVPQCLWLIGRLARIRNIKLLAQSVPGIGSVCHKCKLLLLPSFVCSFLTIEGQ